MEEENMSAEKALDSVKAINFLEANLLLNPAFREGALWGRPRPGHPEGAVIYHIIDVLKNISELKRIGPKEYAKLRFIALVHDTFKHKVDRTQQRTGDNHHAVIARKFVEPIAKEFWSEEDASSVLDIIELHDDAYNAWQKAIRKNKPAHGVQRAMKLIERLGNNLELYLKFYSCDNSTGDKSNEPYEWFFKIVEQNKSRSCVTCHYSRNGETSCFRHMSYADPKIDLSKGMECVGLNNEYVHFLPVFN